jgi:hypothetical protein
MATTTPRRVTMKSKVGRASAALAAVAAAATLAAGFAVPAQAALVNHDGKVLSKESNGTKSFRIKDDETGQKLRFRVNRGTQFERTSFKELRRGLVISVDGHTAGNGLVADKVETDR